ncbi:MAG: tyrosine-type recombinase/integrase, partial [Thermoplasmata archaeon]
PRVLSTVLVLDEVKFGESYRTGVPPQVVAALMNAVVGMEPGKPIWRTSTSDFRRRYKCAIAARGLKYYAPRELRSSVATFAVEADVRPQVLQGQMNHAEYGTTAKFYAKVRPKTRLVDLEKLGRYLMEE